MGYREDAVLSVLIMFLAVAVGGCVILASVLDSGAVTITSGHIWGLIISCTLSIITYLITRKRR